GAEAMQGDVLGPILKAIQPDAAELTAADCLAAAFEPTPKLAERCADETRGRFFRQLMETEQYQALHAETRLDPMASELAAGHFAKGFLALVEQTPTETPEGPPGDTPKSPEEKARDEMRKDMTALGAAAKALEGASKEVDDLREAQRSLGGDGAMDGQRVPASELKARFDRIKESRQLRRIMELAGRYRRMAQAKQRQKVLHGQDDVVGVELGNDLGRLCPSELAAIGDEDLELDAMRRYLERGLMQRSFQGIEPKARGPIVVVVDESGSMNGDPIAMAKAFALAMAWVARHQGRWICLVGFSGRCKPNVLAMPPGRWNQVAMLDWLEHFYSGGSDRDVPLVELPEVWTTLGCPAGDTDIIQITDAYCRVPREMQREFCDWKRTTKAKYYTIVLGHDEPGDLREVSDRIWSLGDLSLENDAIQELMAI
ncbi:MAG: hypothetical protein LLG00_14915, partial [Planctomycetaceae bacterium]|nr:hypothetical protein [Planctomycetaceae bacterium]